jgi:hypothetical protein
LYGETEDLYIHENGKVYYKSPLGGYSELGSVEDVLGCGQSELSGNENFEEILDGDELGKGFKFKMPKMKFKMPKMKFKGPKINTKGLSRGFKAAGKGLSKAASNYGKAWSKVGKGIGKAVSNIARGAGQIAESLLDQQQQAEQPDEEQEQPEDEQEQELNEEQSQNSSEQESEEVNPEELEGYQTDKNGKIFYYSELNGEYIELGSDELGFMSMISNMASGGGNKGGILNMATGALDMFVPGAGTVANIGIGAAQKQRQKQKLKKAKNRALRQNLLRHYQNKKENPLQFIKQTKTTQQNKTQQIKPIAQNRFIQIKPIAQNRFIQTKPVQQNQISNISRMQNFSSRPISRNQYPGAETGIEESNQGHNPTQVQTDKKNQIMFGVGAAILAVITVIYSTSKKGKK